jgi:hypothetical protein
MSSRPCQHLTSAPEGVYLKGSHARNARASRGLTRVELARQRGFRLANFLNIPGKELGILINISHFVLA